MSIYVYNWNIKVNNDSFNIGDVVSHKDISDVSAASDEAESLHELDSHSLLDTGIYTYEHTDVLYVWTELALKEKEK